MGPELDRRASRKVTLNHVHQARSPKAGQQFVG